VKISLNLKEKLRNFSQGLKKRVRNLPPPVREWGVFSGWIAGLLLVCILAWALTGGLRIRLLMNQVNRFLESRQSVWRLAEPLLSRGAGSSRFGSWFALAARDSRDPSSETGLLFMLQSGVQNMAVLAVIDRSGHVESLEPASENARSRFQTVPEGIRALYVRRIEESLAQVRLERMND
jgi:hypothetical protein